jgi:glycosyltransferase involved in cell wall biosynthesis
MKISIGILAYNEAAFIAKMLRSVLGQTLFSGNDPDLQIELLVVPNGCSDNTAAISHTTLSETAPPQIQWKVCELEQGGKANAWNIYVHELSDPDANYLFLMDADIEMVDPQTLGAMIEVLDRRPEATVAVDRLIKDVALKSNKTVLDRLSIAASRLSGNKATEEGPSWLCGQLYCTRAEVLRQIWMPADVSDDGFLYRMIVTDRLQCEEIPERVILAKSASHRFEAYTQIPDLLRHEKWLILGNVINSWIYRDLALESAKSQQDAGLLVKQRNEQDPHWISHYIQSVATQQKWLIPQYILTRRFQSLKYQKLPKAVIFLPLAIAAFLVDLILSIQVNAELHRDRGVRYWS